MGETNRSGHSKFYNLKIDKENDLPVFYRVEKKGDEWVETKSVTGLEGFLKSIKTETFNWQGREIMSVKVSLKDNDSEEMIHITFPMNNAVRSMLNSLAGCDELGLLHFQCSKWGKGEKKYPTIFVENNNQKTKWKFPLDEIPKIDKISENVYDDSEVNRFFKNVINIDIYPKIETLFGERPPSKNYAKVEPEKQEISPEPSNQDLPPYVDPLPF